MSRKGDIKICTGPMWSGKSTWLVDMINREKLKNRKVLVILHKSDTRYSEDKLITHSNIIPQSEELIRLDKFDKSSADIIRDYDSVAIDEGHFFDGIQNFAIECSNLGKDVYISLLLTDSNKKMFQNTKLVAEIATNIKYKRSVCMKCKSRSASYSELTGGSINADGDINVGAEDKYRCVCIDCYGSD